MEFYDGNMKFPHKGYGRLFVEKESDIAALKKSHQRD